MSYSLKYPQLLELRRQHRAVIKFLSLRISTNIYSKLRCARHCSNCSMCIYSFLLSRGMFRGWHDCCLNFTGETTKAPKDCEFDYPQSQVMRLINSRGGFWTRVVSCGACAFITIFHPLSPHTLSLHLLRPHWMGLAYISIFTLTGAFFAILLSHIVCILVIIRIHSRQKHGLTSYLIVESLRQKSSLPSPGASRMRIWHSIAGLYWTCCILDTQKLLNK